MSRGPTLRALLDRVDRQVVRLGPRDYLEVERLVRSRDEWPAAELRAAVASVLARSSDHWSRITILYDEMAGTADSERPHDFGPVHQSELGKTRRLTEARAQLVQRLRNTPRLLWSVCIGSVAVALVITLVYWLLQLTPPAETPAPGKEMGTAKVEVPAEQDGIVLIPLDIDRDLDPVVSKPPPAPEPGVLLGLALLSAAVLWVGVSWLRLPDGYRARQAVSMKARERRSEEKRRRLQKGKALEGRAMGVRYHVQVHLPVSRQAMLDSAELLGRIAGESPGADLDAEATLDRTLAAAGRFEPVMEPRLHRHDVVVLIDTEEANHPWLDGFLRLLDAWAAQGIVLRRFTFSMSPELVVEAETKQPIRLAQLARQTEDLPLIVFSRQLDPAARRGPAAWVPVLSAWQRRAWLDPDPRSRDESSRYRRRSIWELERQGLYRFHLTDEGLVLLGKYLAGDSGGPRPLSREPALAPLPKEGEQTPMAEALRLWALVAALVPDPTWDQLEAIRRHFPQIHRVLPEPRSLQRLLEWVERQSGQSAELEGGRGLAIPWRLQNQWQREQRRIEKANPEPAGFENQARRLLLDQLASTRPDDPMDYETWRFKCSMHQAMLEPHRAAELLKWIDTSAVRHEAIRWLRAELARRDAGDGEPLPLGDREFLARVVGEGGKIPLRALTSGLGWNHWSHSFFFAGAGVLWAFLCTAGIYGELILEGFEREIKNVAIERPAIYEVTERSHLPTMIDLPGGSFLMGDSDSQWDDERPVHQVRVAAVQISRTEVTVAQYRACVEADGCSEPAADAGTSCNWDDRDDHPMNCVSWNEARRYAEWIGARLPSEAEWEYAARSGGLDQKYPWGETEPTCDLAVVRGCGDGTQPVCSKTKGNTEQGLCDMAGNVWEWVEDDWHQNYNDAPVGGNAWVESPRASIRVFRGGSWRNDPRFARVAYRLRDEPSRRYDFLGFRVARSLPSSL